MRPCRRVSSRTAVDRRTRVEHQGLEAGDDRVAAEGRHEPGHGGRDDAPVVRVHQHHAQVGLPAAQHAGDLLRVGEDVGGAREPALVVAAQVGQAGGEVALAQRRGVGHRHLDREAHDLALARRQAHAKGRRAALQARRLLFEAHDRLAQDFVEAVVGQRERVAVDLGREARAALVAAHAAHLEHVAKVGVEGELDDHLDRRRVVVLDAQQLVHAVGDQAGAAHVHRSLRDGLAVGALDREVRELGRRHVVALGGRREQDRRASAHGHLESREKARVAKVEAERRVLGGRDEALVVGVHEELVLLDDEPPAAGLGHHEALGAGGDRGLLPQRLEALVADDDLVLGARRAGGRGARRWPGCGLWAAC